MLFFSFYLFLLENNAEQCMHNLLKCEVTGKFAIFNFSILNLKIRKPIKFSDTSCRDHQLMSPICSGSPAELISFHHRQL